MPKKRKFPNIISFIADIIGFIIFIVVDFILPDDPELEDLPPKRSTLEILLIAVIWTASVVFYYFSEMFLGFGALIVYIIFLALIIWYYKNSKISQSECIPSFDMTVPMLFAVPCIIVILLGSQEEDFLEDFFDFTNPYMVYSFYPVLNIIFVVICKVMNYFARKMEGKDI